MDLAINNLQRVICHKTQQPTIQPTNQKKEIAFLKKSFTNFSILIFSDELMKEIEKANTYLHL